MTDSGSEREEWRPIAGFEGLYDVSDLGRIRSYRHTPPMLLSPWPDEDGYLRIGLWDGEVQKKFPLHRLVALTFHADKRNALHNEAAHLDGDRANARADNLKWVSKVENMSHKKTHGTHLAGASHPHAKLGEADVLEIIRRLSDGETPGSIAARFEVSAYAIADIRRGRNWRHVPRPELFKAPLSQDGARNHNAKFTPQDVAEIRRRRAQGDTCQAVADDFGVWKGTISRIARLDAYRSEIPSPDYPG